VYGEHPQHQRHTTEARRVNATAVDAAGAMALLAGGEQAPRCGLQRHRLPLHPEITAQLWLQWRLKTDQQLTIALNIAVG